MAVNLRGNLGEYNLRLTIQVTSWQTRKTLLLPVVVFSIWINRLETQSSAFLQKLTSWFTKHHSQVCKRRETGVLSVFGVFFFNFSLCFLFVFCFSTVMTLQHTKQYSLGTKDTSQQVSLHFTSWILDQGKIFWFVLYRMIYDTRKANAQRN